MANIVWKGAIRFGLVNIPVALHTAERHAELDFTLLDRKDHSPIGYRKVNKRTGREVPRTDLVRAMEVEEGRFVEISDEEIRRALPERTQRIDIMAFVGQDEIDPVYFARPYYLEPAEQSERAYAILREALRRTGRVGIASVVFRTREHVCALMARGPLLVLDVLRYPQELRDPGELNLPPAAVEKLGIAARELEMAERLVSEMAEPWDPERHRDRYRDELLEVIRQKARTGAVPAPAVTAPLPRAGEPLDLMALLKRSVEERAGRPGRRKTG